MARLVVVLLLLTWIGANYAPPAGNENEKTEDARANKASAGQKPNEAPPTVVQKQTIHSELCEQKSQAQAANSANHPYGWAEHVNAISTLVIAVFTVFLFVAVLVQVKTSRDTERAWVTVLPGIWSPDLKPIWEQGDPIPADGNLNPLVHMFPAIIRNVGKTAARIDEIAVRYVLLKSLSELKSTPAYGEGLSRDGYLLVPKEETNVVHTILTDGTNGGMLTKSQVGEIQNGKKFLYAYGFVNYRDAYKRPHKTRFGYVYSFPQGGWINFEKPAFKRDGPKKYNEAT